MGDMGTFQALFPWLSRVHSGCSCVFRYSQESNFAVFYPLVGGNVFVILGPDVSCHLSMFSRSQVFNMLQ